MEEKNNLVKIAVVAIFLILVATSTVQAVVLINDGSSKDKKLKLITSDGPSITWEDDFLDKSKIDIELSYNYIVDKSVGEVMMVDTYNAWYNPEWTRMKPIIINNRGSQTFNDYVLDLLVYYDSDMQSDFRDLRFTDDKGNDL